MKKFYLCLLLVFLAAGAVAADDPIIKVAGLIRQDNIHALTALMAESVEVSLPGNDGSYSSSQAETLLTNFFSQNRPLSVKVLHKISSSPQYRFGVLLVNTTKGLYRVALTLKETNGTFQLIEFRVEKEKVR